MDKASPPAAHIQLASSVRETGRLHAWLDQVLADVPETAGHAVRLCLEEAVMNVIMHGYGAGKPGHIEVRLWRGPGQVVTDILDDAAPFLWQKPPRRAAAALADAPVGGLGLGLIHTYASDIQAGRAEGRNRLRLLFTLGQA